MNLFISKQKYNSGFTLIELLMVISIIALITSIVLAALSNAKMKARDTAKIRTLKEVQNALQVYHSDNGYYPSGSELDTSLYNIVKALTTNNKYISAVATTTIKYQAVTSDTNTSPCSVNYTCQSYRLGVALEDRSNRILASDVLDSNPINSFDSTTDTCLISGSAPVTGNNLCYAVKP
jgi:prepilin-type N-terminal cleavage/methylation domain-containing protein